MAKAAGIRVEGLSETLRALRGIPADANRAIRAKSFEIARQVASDAADGFVTPQAAPLIRGLKPANDRIPTLKMGGSASSGLSGGATLGQLIGANFGSAGRYKQFPPKRRPDYYVYAAIKRDSRYIIDTWTEAIESVATEFDRG